MGVWECRGLGVYCGLGCGGLDIFVSHPNADLFSFLPRNASNSGNHSQRLEWCLGEKESNRKRHREKDIKRAERERETDFAGAGTPG